MKPEFRASFYVRGMLITGLFLAGGCAQIPILDQYSQSGSRPLPVNPRGGNCRAELASSNLEIESAGKPSVKLSPLALVVSNQEGAGVSFRVAGDQVDLECYHGSLFATVFDSEVKGEFTPHLPIDSVDGREFVPVEWLIARDGAVLMLGNLGGDSGGVVEANLRRTSIDGEVEWSWDGPRLRIESDKLADARSLVRLPEPYCYAAISNEAEILLFDLDAQVIFDVAEVDRASSLLPARPGDGGDRRAGGFDLMVVGEDSADVRAFFYYGRNRRLDSKVIRSGDTWVVLRD